jgi:beta-glucosidase
MTDPTTIEHSEPTTAEETTNRGVSRRTVLAGIGGGAALTATTALLTGAPAGAAPVVPAPGAAPAPGTVPDGTDSRAPGAGKLDPAEERRVEALLARMTTAEKFGQMTLANTPDIAKTELAEPGGLGGVFSVIGVAALNELQKIAVEQTRLGIPLIFGLDVIHGYTTNFPIPLAQASSWDPAVGNTDATLSAAEARRSGIHWTYAPMMDVSHEPRWGRIAEGNGEDPYLTSQFAVGKVQGYQGSDYSAQNRLAACMKHYVAYGQPEGGRDYNTVDVSIQRLHNLYLPPFLASVQAGVATVMTSFNTVSGVPAHGDVYTLRDVLKGSYAFDGFVVSDYTGIQELIPHGLVGNGRGAARAGITAGVDMEMVSTNYRLYGPGLLQSGAITMDQVDDAVRRMLRIKIRLGLFEQPYADPSREVTSVSAANRAAARRLGSRSMVLLKNDAVGGKAVLPIPAATKNIAVIGPLAKATYDLNGTWAGLGTGAGTTPPVTPVQGLTAAGKTVTYRQGCNVNDADTSKIAAAVAAARAADLAVLVVGETADMSGEASARSNIGLPGVQLQLVQQVAAAQPRTVVVLVNGRPLTLSEVEAAVPAIVEAWAPGVEAGNAIADVLTGAVNPGGKLPVSFPRAVGQVPIYYNHENTGRPYDPDNKYTSKYLDLPDGPLFAFGHGLSYTDFELANLRVSSASLASSNGTVDVTVDVTNVGARAGDEVVQLYIHDPVASIVQPVRRLRGFSRVTLARGATQTVTFRLTPNDVGFFDNDARFLIEKGEIVLYVGRSSDDDASLTTTITVV